MDKEFVSYEQAKSLIELGFNENCFRGYDFQNDRFFITDNIYDGHYLIFAPLKQQALRWFREKYELDSYIFSWSKREIGWGYDIRNDLSTVKQTNDNIFNTYEEAENACIDKLIELSKQLNKQ